MKHSLRRLAAAALLVPALAQAAPMLPAGTVISNTAAGQYVDARSATDWHVRSNTVQAVVAAVPGAQLTSDQVISSAPGSQFVLHHTLTNTGNSAQTYTITLSQSSPQGVVALNLKVLQDLNSSGVVSPGDPVVATTSQGSTLTLQQGQSVSLIITGSVPASAAAGSSVQLGLAASALGVAVSNADTVQVRTGASLDATLQTSTSKPQPGQALTWVASVGNTGQATAQGQTVVIDGQAQQDVVLELPVPAQMAFASAATSTSSARVLYHLAGQATNAFVSQLPAGAQVDEVAWATPSLAPAASLQGSLVAQVSATASGLLSAQAQAVWFQQGLGQVSPSNTVSLSLPAASAVIGFYTNGSFSTQAAVASAGQPLYVQFTAGQCNTNPTQVVQVPVQLTSSLSKDRETFLATETAANSGVFRIDPSVPTLSALRHVVVPGDGTMEVLPNDQVTAAVSSCGGAALSISASVLIDPSGTVYSSSTDQVVAGARVTLIDVTGQGNGGAPGQEAAVFEADGTTPAPASVVTGPSGQYSFPLVEPSTYELKVTPGSGWSFPSQVAPSQQPLDRTVDPQASYGLPFVVQDAGPVRDDIPLDPAQAAPGKLFVQKTASTSTVQLGGFVNYAVALNNQTGKVLSAVNVHDHLPMGFAYVRGSARYNGQPLADPAGQRGPDLDFSIGSLAAGTQGVLSYRVLVGAGAAQGTGINTAQAQSAAVISNVASAQVQVQPGVFSSDGYIIGKVYANCSGAGTQQAADLGVPGVRIYLENGEYAVTDAAGRFSFYGLSARTHVAHVDATTLPAGARLQLLDNLQAGDPTSRFVPMAPGELAKANFALGPCTPALMAQIAARAKAWRHPSEVLQASSELLQSQVARTTDPRQLPAAAVLGPGASYKPLQEGAEAPLAVDNLGAVGDFGAQSAHARALPSASNPGRGSAEPGRATPAPGPVPLEKLLPTLPRATGFVGLQDGQVLASSQSWIRVYGPLGADLQLLVNGRPVSVKQVGKKATLASHGVQAWEYVGVDLKPGPNTLELLARDAFGNVRGRATLHVIAPGKLARIVVQAPSHAVADGKSLIPVRIRLQDAHGVPFAQRTELTLEASNGRWQVRDADPLQPGVQVYVQGGQATYELLAPVQTGKLDVQVRAAQKVGHASILLGPYLRPMIAVGLASIRLDLSHLAPSSIHDVLASDAFAQELQTTAASFDAGQGSLGARTSLFLKGKVLGSSLLTLAYDSNKPSSSSLLRDINPNDFYPVYGDSSIKGFDAQSTGKLYVLLQHGQSSFLLGDFNTQSQDPARSLTQVSRVLHGVKAAWQNKRVELDGFASQTSNTQEVVEFRANGTSGPFQLNLNGVQGSAQVSIVVRDKTQPSVVLKSTALSEFTDYTIEPFTGLLTLNQPVSSFDPDLNPQYIRVVYEIASGGPKHWVAEGDARAALTPSLHVGAMVYRDEDPAQGLHLQGLYATWKLYAGATLLAEAANSQALQYGAGTGERLDFRGPVAGAQLHAWAVHTSAFFDNPSALQQQGASQYGVQLDKTLSAKNALRVQALSSANALTQARQDGAKADVVHVLPGNARLVMGLRYSRANAQAVLAQPIAPGASAPAIESAAPLSTQSLQQTSYLAARVKLDAAVPHLKGADAYVLGEQSLTSPGRETGVGANYQINPSTKLYVRHDFQNSLASPYLLDAAVSQYTTVAGVESTFAGGTQAFDEYRVGDNLDGQTVEDAMGLKHQWMLRPGLGLTAGFQQIKPLSGPTLDQSQAINTELSYSASKDWRAAAQLQWQRSASSQSYFATVAVAQRLSQDWTLLNRAMYSLQQPTQAQGASMGGARKIVDVQSGVALRPVHEDVWNALGQIEYKRTLDGTLAPGPALDTQAWIGALNLNVQPSRTWDTSWRYALERASDNTAGLSSTAFTQLLGATSSWDLTPKWDAGVQASRMWGAGAAARSEGVHVGYLLGKNIWLTVGYNLTGFDAPDLQGDTYTQQGVFVQLRLKFTENSFPSWGNGS